MRETMKAAIIREHGPVENVTIATDLPVPEPGSDEVRLRVRAAALNYLDIWVRNGWPGIKLSLPHILGADAAGTIDALGANVRDWEIGARVAVGADHSAVLRDTKAVLASRYGITHATIQIEIEACADENAHAERCA